MAKIISNKGEIKYNDTEVSKTCPVLTSVEPNVNVKKYAVTDKGTFKDTGTVGESRKITYEILLVNSSSVDFTDLVIKDIISLSGGVPISKAHYITSESLFPNLVALPNIELHVGTLPKHSDMLVYYTIELDESVPIGTEIKNKAEINYKENPIIDPKTGKQIPYSTHMITLTLSYLGTKVEATKTGPEHVLCGQEFEYVLTFENKGKNTAKNITVQDELPSGYLLEKVEIKNGVKDLHRNTDYTYIDGANPLEIKSMGSAMDIAPGTKLVVTLKGKYLCV